MKVDILFVRERVLNKSLILVYLPADIADILTKPLSKSQFASFRDQLKVLSLSQARACGGVTEYLNKTSVFVKLSDMCHISEVVSFVEFSPTSLKLALQASLLYYIILSVTF